LMRAFTFEYAISGPWKDPQVKKLDRNIGPPAPIKEPGQQSSTAQQNG
jgi:hypothetical protein